MIDELKEAPTMILKNQIITDIIIKDVNDLYKLKPFLEDGTLKINKSQLAREISEKADHPMLTKLPFVMKLIWVNKLSWTGKNLFHLYFLLVKKWM